MSLTTPRPSGIRAPGAQRPRRQRGSILILAMFVVFGMAALVLVLGRSMRVETLASANLASSLQAMAIERGAEQYVLAALVEQKDSLADLGEEYFACVPVGNGYFWILRPDYGDDQSPVFGLTDEAGKININSASYNTLMKLPNMTDDVAAAIVDWRDTDETSQPGGAENEYYQSLPEPYTCKNAPFETVEELLLVRNFTRELLYGAGDAPPLGEQSQFHSGGFTTDLQTARGLYDYLTIYSSETSTAADGSQRINLNDENQRTQLRDLLQKQLGTNRGDEIVNAMGRNGRFQDVFDFYFQVKMKSDELAKVIDNLTATATTGGGAAGGGGAASAAAQKVSGRVNVNSAPREVLFCLGSLESADVDKLLTERQRAASTTTNSIAWVVDALDRKAIGLGNLITGKSSRYSADILAVSGDGRAFKRVRIVVDASGTEPQIIYRRDLTDRGWPMDPEILTAMRSGQGPGNWSTGRSSTMGGGSR